MLFKWLRWLFFQVLYAVNFFTFVKLISKLLKRILAKIYNE
jgi:hypothetical protein